MSTFKKIMISGVSAAVIMAATPGVVFSADMGANTGNTGNNADTQMTQSVTKEDIKNTMDEAGRNIAEGAESVVQLPMKAYHDLRQQLGEADKPAMYVDATDKIVVDLTQSATYIIGSSILDGDGHIVATVDDIILGEDGAADKLILRDGGFFGFGGKLIALDYAAVRLDTPQGGEIFKRVDESFLEKIAAYDKDSDFTGTAVSTLFGTAVKSPAMEQLAKVDDIVITGNKADYMILVFNDFSGIGGEEAVIAYNQDSILRDENGSYVRLTQAQADALKVLRAQGGSG